METQQGASFIITKTPYDGGEVTVPVYVTDENGKIEINIEAGEYYVTEIEPPVHYEIIGNATNPNRWPNSKTVHSRWKYNKTNSRRQSNI